MTLRIAVVGATGAVGREMLDCLASSRLPLGKIRVFASARSAGSRVLFGERSLEVERLDDRAVEDLRRRGLDLVLLAAGREAARAWAPRLLETGALVIDNSSAFRGDPGVPLVVPEVNLETVGRGQRLVANPNCSTILACTVLGPLHRAFGLRRLVAATYQAASGAGAAGLRELEDNVARGLSGEPPRTAVFGRDLAFNAVPWIGAAEGLDAEEEAKLRRETRRILDAPDLEVSCTAVRIPVRRAHALALVAEFAGNPSPEQAAAVLKAAPGVGLREGVGALAVPTPLDASGGDLVLVGRLRKAFEVAPGLALFAVGDQLRKGAALNAVAIAEALLAPPGPDGP